jgi:hypothetical protein
VRLEAGYWLLAAGYWLLAAGFWILVPISGFSGHQASGIEKSEI